jgi:hypothetical protein
MKKTNKERYEEAAPNFRKLLKSMLLFLKVYLRKIFMLKDDPTLPRKKRRRPRG